MRQPNKKNQILLYMNMINNLKSNIGTVNESFCCEIIKDELDISLNTIIPPRLLIDTLQRKINQLKNPIDIIEDKIEDEIELPNIVDVIEDVMGKDIDDLFKM